MTEGVQVLVPARTILGEGATWDASEGVLYWVDIQGKTLFRYDPATKENRAYEVGQRVGAMTPWREGSVVLAVQEGLALFDLASETLEVVARPEANKPDNRFNDGNSDPAGRFWAGTMSMSGKKKRGSLYRLDPDWSVHHMVGDLTISNGLAWSPDHRTMYLVDTGPGTVTAYDYDLSTGEIRNGRVAIKVPDGLGYPDGMTIDEEGMLWTAMYGGSCVCRWDPASGELLMKIDLPASKVTSCAFGGPDMTTLYITTATEGMSKEEMAREPEAGSLFAAIPGVRGLPTGRFAGEKRGE